MEQAADSSHTIICGDPARSNDRFAFTGVNLIHRIRFGRHFWRINVRFARQYMRTPFADVARDMEPLINHVQPHYFGMETNNEGREAINAFRSRGFSPQEITTVGRLSEENRQRRMDRMDKGHTVRWFVRCAKAPPTKKPAFVYFPNKPSDHMKVLQEQIQMIQVYITPNGSITYKAMANRHNDLFMSFLMCCHVARVHIEMTAPSSQESWEQLLR